MAKVNVTLSIDKQIKTDFQVETILNGHEMSSAVEQFMGDYVKKSKQLRDERVLRNNNNGQEEEE